MHQNNPQHMSTNDWQGPAFIGSAPTRWPWAWICISVASPALLVLLRLT